MANPNTTIIYSPSEISMKIHKWKVREGFQVTNNQVILLYELNNSDDKEIKRFKATKCGIVKKRYYKEGDTVDTEHPLLDLTDCIHATVIKDMCADCGADLRQDDNGNQSEASVPMVHSVPELKVSRELAQELGKADTARLLEERKLVLLVDLDQTIIHTTNDNVPHNLRNVYHFQLYGPHSPWYHTRLRPGTFEFLKNMASYFELHICTFGARNYAHTIAQFLDSDGKYFSHRILSRDECLSLTCKTDNLKALFPCGDSMVCIIDDREDVWNMATNLIQVKPYHFFQHTGDINAPPGLSKHELDGKGVDFKDLKKKQKDAGAKDENNKIDGGEGITKKTNENKKPNDDKKNEANETTDGKEVKVAEENNKTKTETSGEDNEKKIESSETKVDDPKMEAESSEKKAESSENDVKSSEELAEKTKLKVEESPKETESTSEKKSDGDAASKKPNEDKEKEKEKDTQKNEEGDSDNLIDIEDPDDYLLYLESILIKIHSEFYTHYNETEQIPDLKTLIPKIRSKVLLGKTLVFSGLVPNQIKLEKSRTYLIARSLGANVTQQLTNETTHLVASTASTFKVNAARKRPEINIVSPEWLWSCAERWECVDERLFPLDSRKSSKMRQPPAHCHSPEHVVNYNSNEDVDSSHASSNPDAKPKFIDTINPLLSFSNDDLAAMNEDVDEIYESDSSDDDPVDIENPPVNKSLRKRKREEELEEAQLKLLERDQELKKLRREDSDKDNDSTDEDSGDESPSDKFRRGCDLPSDLDMGSNCGSANSDTNDEGDDGDWNMMGAALEREFLGLD